MNINPLLYDPLLRVFPLLADPSHYVACPLDLTADDDQRKYWIDLFRWHLGLLADQSRHEHVLDPGIEKRVEVFEGAFHGFLDMLSEQPQRFGRLDIITICWAREKALRNAGIDDPYRSTKAAENNSALKLLGPLLESLDGAHRDEWPQRLIEGVLAGNIFDLGATKTVELFKEGTVDFHATRRALRPRPWLIDDLDGLLGRWGKGPHRSAVLFVDNAGCDILLGMIPLARELLRRGTDVLLTANSTPSLNDVTHEELTVLIERVAEQDRVVHEALADGRLELVPSGNGVPLIDLSMVSRELAEAVERRHIDLVVLEGMGRAIESNLDASFTCDAIKIAMVKDPGVARLLGGALYDLVLKFEPAGGEVKSEERGGRCRGGMGRSRRRDGICP